MIGDWTKFANFAPQFDLFQVRDLSFPKSDRLHHRSLVEGLFRNGKSFYEYPFRVVWRIITQEELQKNFRDRLPENVGKLQILVTVPKKKRRRAVDRVLMRRRIKEAYRLNRTSLQEIVELSQEIGTMSVAVIYLQDENLDYKSIEGKMRLLLGKLQKKLM